MNTKGEHRGAVAIIWIDNPDRRNAVTPELVLELVSRIKEAEADPLIRTVVLTGSGGTFCAGGDLRNMPPESPAAAQARLEIYASLMTQIRSSKLPFVCAIDGVAAGIGVSIALACDLVVAARDSQFLFPFSRIGLYPDGGLVRLLGERIGSARAKALLLLGHPVSATDAERSGMIDQLADSDSALPLALEVATTLAEGAPLSIQSIKAGLRDGLPDYPSAIQFEISTQTKLYFSNDFAIGRQAFFTKSTAHFAGD